MNLESLCIRYTGVYILQNNPLELECYVVCRPFSGTELLNLGAKGKHIKKRFYSRGKKRFSGRGERGGGMISNKIYTPAFVLSLLQNKPVLSIPSAPHGILLMIHS